MIIFLQNICHTWYIEWGHLVWSEGIQTDLSDIYLLLNLFSGLRDTLQLIAAVGFQIENLSLKLI